MSMLDLQGVGRRYGATAALEGIDLAVPPGSRTVVVGPSGSGKTTLLRIIAGFEAPDAGRVWLGGALVADGPAAVPAHLRGIGFVTQDGALFPHLDVAANIGFGLPRHMPGRDARIAELMATVELDAALLARRPHQLSGGQQQRVALARALARQPRLMLLDEPFSALDTGLRESTRKAVGDVLRAAGITTILVTHDQPEALAFGDQVAVLRDGRLVQAGTPREVYLTPADRTTAAFLGEAILLPADIAGGRAHCALGAVAVASGAKAGPGEIMLRPEQLRLSAAVPGEDAGACCGQLAEAEFGGAANAVAVSIFGEKVLRFKYYGPALPPAGSRLKIEVAGVAHVFGARL